MRIKPGTAVRASLIIALMVCVTMLSTRLYADTGMCGGANITLPFTDLPSSDIFFCSVAEAFFSGLTNGTSGTTFGPGNSVPREQMAAFVTRTMDQSLKRGSNRAALGQFSTPTSTDGFGLTTVSSDPRLVESDGADLWVTSLGSDRVSRVRASDGKLIGTWTGPHFPIGVLAAKGMIFVTTETNPGSLYRIDPTQPPGAATLVTAALGSTPIGIAFDGARIWTANFGGSVSIVTLNPLSVSTVTAGFTRPQGILYDGANIWVTDNQTGMLMKLDSNGAILQQINVGVGPQYPVFDGTNIWVPNFASNSLTVVRASTGVVLATLTGNGLITPTTAAFDGERILVTTYTGNSVSLWKAVDLSPIASVGTGGSPNTLPFGACSDGLNFWVALEGTGKLARF